MNSSDEPLAKQVKTSLECTHKISNKSNNDITQGSFFYFFYNISFEIILFKKSNLFNNSLLIALRKIYLQHSSHNATSKTAMKKQKLSHTHQKNICIYIGFRTLS